MENHEFGIECRTSNGDYFYATGADGNRMKVGNDKYYPFKTRSDAEAYAGENRLYNCYSVRIIRARN